MLSFFHQTISFIHECIIGLKIAFKHNYWILKYLLRKVWSNILKVLSNKKNQEVKDQILQIDQEDAPGFKVVGVGFGRTGTVSLALFV